MQLPKVGDVVEKLDMPWTDHRFFFILENPYERYYKVVNVATGQRWNWSLGWRDNAELDWEREWRIV